MCRQTTDRKKAMESDLKTGGRELEELRRWETEQNTKSCIGHRRFPSACLRLLKGIEGNLFCVDCGASNPQWAAVSYGTLLCLQCSGKHRQLGVQLSVVRSITMDSWSHRNVLAMLEGGNKQCSDFFDRHGLPSDNHDQEVDRYQTNAAMFYRNNLSLHIKHVEDLGEYKGRDWSRKMRRKKRKSSSSSSRCGKLEKKEISQNELVRVSS